MDIWQLLFGFEGRINRAKYWGGMGLLLIWALITSLITYLLTRRFGEGVGQIADWIAGAVPTVASCAITAKRFHDRNRSGWWQLLIFVPILFLLTALVFQMTPLIAVTAAGSCFVGIWIFIETGCLPGTAGPNRFGPDPLAQTQAAAI